MNLLIVESPAKAKTIEGYLGSNFLVLSSYGHIRDLPPKKLGVDIKHNYKPEYAILFKAKANLSRLKAALKKAKKIYLATDYDREGEAIAWHLVQALGLQQTAASKQLPPGSRKQEAETLRITFTEITKQAIDKAVLKPRPIDMDLVDAQQARRILDRLVGYKLSPFLWKKIARGLSAGRVQSVAVRLIVEKEREIEKFKAQEYWEVVASLAKKKIEDKFKAKLIEKDGKKIARLDIKSSTEAKKIETELSGAKYIVNDIIDKERKSNPLPPYRTSTLQQDAARRLRFTAKKTMFIAQKLYEGVDLGKGKRVGLITYMRTDSINLSKEAIGHARDYIREKLGEKYLPELPNIYKTKSLGAQEAHEAIRPTDPKLEPAAIKDRLARDEYRLYELVWKRMIASQMKAAQILERTVKVKAGGYIFSASGKTIKFEGCLKIYSLGLKDVILPDLRMKEELDLKSLDLNQKFTEPPSRYTEASLVKELEKKGIGRPSTYAPIMSTIQDRHYVSKEKGYFHPVEIGILVNDVLVEHFPEIVDYNFTAMMEGDLDKIASGKLDWIKVVDEFFKPFNTRLKLKEKTLKKEDIAHEKTSKICPHCKGEIIIKMGRYGRFYACSNYPKCDYKEKIEEKKIHSPQVKRMIKKAEEILEKHPKCEKCGSDMVVRTSRFGTFLGCSGYPKCRNIIAVEDDLDQACPKCKDGKVVRRYTRKGKIFWGCSRYPDCDFASWTKPK